MQYCSFLISFPLSKQIARQQQQLLQQQHKINLLQQQIQVSYMCFSRPIEGQYLHRQVIHLRWRASRKKTPTPPSISRLLQHSYHLLDTTQKHILTEKSVMIRLSLRLFSEFQSCQRLKLASASKNLYRLGPHALTASDTQLSNCH